MNNRRVLVIEDDADAADVLEAYLLREGYTVEIAGNGLHGLERVEMWKPDLILLDIMLPGMNGTEVLEAVRRRSDTPVIMITAMADTPDRIGALRHGADDYVVKPYHPGEVVARVQAVLRRSHAPMAEDEVLRWQALEVNTAAMTAMVTHPGKRPTHVELTPTEFSLLVTLMRAPVRALSRQYLIETCMPDSEALERVIDTHVYNLRKKLENVGLSEILLNVRGVGYRFRQP
ncbi:chemotaxis protein CheY [Pantoea sp. RIT-PI-b]|uniref:response regulator transcription factor n=1 Tax=Pantoea sp. RIT-PI-b TaxID=1681195 RepID=UPI000675F31F|nr:response regulator transcription factor [Pantoea sp. RIT-PI-b]KNC05748.1 chemotaxis protein CheY [Pantoea sp. RIT-PI-b]